MIYKPEKIENYKYLDKRKHLFKEICKYKVNMLHGQGLAMIKSLNQAQRVAGVGSWEMDFINKKSFWSDEAYRIYGITKEQYDNTYEGFKKLHKRKLG